MKITLGTKTILTGDGLIPDLTCKEISRSNQHWIVIK